MKYGHYSEELKRQAINEYLLSNLSLERVAKKYGIKSRVALYKWVKKFENQEKSVPLHPETQNSESMDKYDKMDAESLRQRLREVEADLQHARLQNLALNTMIDIAEEQGIRIRKKSGAKQ